MCDPGPGLCPLQALVSQACQPVSLPHRALSHTGQEAGIHAGSPDQSLRGTTISIPFGFRLLTRSRGTQADLRLHAGSSCQSHDDISNILAVDGAPPLGQKPSHYQGSSAQVSGMFPLAPSGSRPWSPLCGTPSSRPAFSGHLSFQTVAPLSCHLDLCVEIALLIGTISTASCLKLAFCLQPTGSSQGSPCLLP